MRYAFVLQIGAHDKMGMQVVPLADLEELVPKTMTVPLLKNMDANDEANTKKFRGELTFEMTYKPFKNVSCFCWSKDLIKSEPI